MEGLKPIPWAPEKIELEETSCPVCARRDFRFLLRAENFHLEPALFTGKGYRPYPLHPAESAIVECRGCGLVQLNPRRKTQDLLGLNNALHLVKEYKDGKVDSGEILTGQGDRALREARIAKVMSFKASGRWLDVGCGAGRDLEAVVEKGFEGYGVELSEVKKDFYRNKRFVVHVGSFEEVPFPIGHFDVISMWDVLEHVEEPNRALQKVLSLLKPDGIFVAKVPNHAALSRRINRSRWDMYHPLHLAYFTRDTLCKLLAKNGLQIRHACSINPYGMGCLLKDAVRAFRGLPKQSNPEGAAPQSTPQEKPRPIALGLAQKAFRLIDWLPKQISLRLLAGNFLVVIAQKTGFRS